MRQRIKQFITALTAKITPADRAFVKQYLTPAEERLFWQMNRPDQRHTLNVAYTVLRLIAGRAQIRRFVLIKSALLHDVGKTKGDVSTADKVITVLARRLLPGPAARWGRPGRGGRFANLRHAFYIYFHHPARGAQLLKQAGTEAAVVEIVAKHHAAPVEEDPPELIILRQADDKN
ncbi:HD domain-containing protein [Lucifera butyrica]|nr:HD domain-containing protein [Lucifera butyrica]